MKVEIDVAGSLSFMDLGRAAFGSVRIIFGWSDWVVAQAEQKIVAQSAGKQIRGRADIADTAAGHRGWQGRDVDAADRHSAAGRPGQACEQQSKLVLAAAALADDRDVLVERNAETDGVEDPTAIVLGERQISNDDLAGSGVTRSGSSSCSRASIMPSGWNCSTICSYLIWKSLGLLIKIEQLLPRRGQVLVGEQHRERAQRKARRGSPDSRRSKRKRRALAVTIKLFRNLTKNFR